MIRSACFSDIPAIVGILEEGYRRSHYAKEGKAEIDQREAKRLLLAAIGRHGDTNGGACWVQVSQIEGGGLVRGFILGTLARVYGIGNKLMATDMYWLMGAGAPVGDAYRLMRGLVEWGKANPNVVEIKCGTTAAILDDPEEAGVILERLGMKRYGAIYRMET